MLRRLCGPRQFLFEFQPCVPVLPVAVMLLTRWLRHGTRWNEAPTSSIHRLQRGPRYLILFAPRAFAPQQSVTLRRRCLRHWCSSRYLLHPPLHRESIQSPLPHSKLRPYPARIRPLLNDGLSHGRDETATGPFAPNNSGESQAPTYYRGCCGAWRSRCLFEQVSNSPRLAPRFKVAEGRPPSRIAAFYAAGFGAHLRYSPLLPP